MGVPFGDDGGVVFLGEAGQGAGVQAEQAAGRRGEAQAAGGEDAEEVAVGHQEDVALGEGAGHHPGQDAVRAVADLGR